MIESSSNSNADTRKAANRFVGWLLFPLSLFPLVALLTYDWRAIPFLNLPAAHSSNWIGALGDYFAYWGYLAVGFAVWVIPVICIFSGVLRIFGKRMGTGWRKLYMILFIFSLSCLLQVVQGQVPQLSSMLKAVNIPNAGGATGYLMMTRFLSPLLSDFGSSVIMLVVMIFALVATIGLRNIARIIKDIYYWAMLGGSTTGRREASPDEAELPPHTTEVEDPREAQLRDIREAREAAKLEREREKAMMQQQKDAEKAAAKAAREAAKAAARNVQRPKPQSAPEIANGEGVPDKGPYVLPPLDLLDPVKNVKADHSDTGVTGQRLIDTLKLFNVDATLSYKVEGPVVTKYAIELKPGTKYSVVTSLSDNLMGALHAKSLRIEAPIPGEDRVGIEVPNTKPVGIGFREIFEGETFRNCHYELPLLFRILLPIEPFSVGSKTTVPVPLPIRR